MWNSEGTRSSDTFGPPPSGGCSSTKSSLSSTRRSYPRAADQNVAWRSRSSTRITTDPTRSTASSAQERLRAGAVAHHEDGVLLSGVAGGVEQPGAALGRALPDPPAVVRVERGRLARQGRGEAVTLVDQSRHRVRTGGLGLARVRVVLADVRGHGLLPPPGDDEPVAASCE